MSWKGIAIIAALAVMAGPVNAQVVLDGSIAGDGYGGPAAVQTVQTQFGDNFSELNAAYGFTSGGNLHLTLTGNLENNFNKLNIFIDSVAGGQNMIDAATNPTNDGWAAQYDGFMFDNNFAADYLIIARNGNFGGPRFDLDFNSVGNTSVVETTNDIFGGSFAGSNAAVGASGIGVGFDNSNTAGILGGTGAANSAAAIAVQTGLELVIPLSAIGSPAIGDTILISAQVNGSNHDFLSNQFLGGLQQGTGNLGGPVGNINLKEFAGDQHFGITVVPEPSAACILGVAALGLLRRRR